ncbi:hypothetical protein [Pseudobutyrivibrio sp.]|nr:hypothetical protein [Pseudobutyrivibrio sp.]
MACQILSSRLGFHLATGQQYKGGVTILVDAPLEKIPVFDRV